jgi:hypothetical protein
MKLSTLLLATYIQPSIARILLDQDYERSLNTIELTARPAVRTPFQSPGLGHLPLESAYNGTDLQVGLSIVRSDILMAYQWIGRIQVGTPPQDL